MDRKSYFVSHISYLKRLHRRTFFIALPVLIIFGPIVAYLILNAHPASAAWFNNNWSYRQAITITNSTGSAATNLQKLFTVNTSTLVSAGKLQSNCYDLRFTDASGNLLPYYIDSGCNTTTTKVWVLINNLPTNTSTIYMYYGNPTATQGSNSAQFDNVVGLVGYWTMNDTSGSTATDSSVDSNTGTATGTTISTGKYADDRSFNGTSDYVQVADSTSLRVGDPYFTFEAWINPSSLSGCGSANCIIFNKEGSYEWALSSNGHLEWAIANTSPGWAWEDTGIVVPTNQWTHIVLAYDGAHVKAYANGTLQSTISATGSVNNTNYQNALRIAARGAPGGAGSFFPGQIDDVKIYNTDRTTQQIANDYNNPGTIATAGLSITYSFGSETQAPGPIAYWKFDEGYGTVAHDSTSNGNNGTLSGSTLPQWEPKDQCISGKCLYFNGSTSYISVSNNASLDITSKITLSAWVKTSNIASGQVIISRGNNEYTLQIDTTGKVELAKQNVLYLVTSNSTIALNQWYYIVATYDGTSAKIYINGVLDASNTVSNSFAGGTANLTIGDINTGSNTWFFDGFIDEPKIYNYARSASQILSDYNSALAGGGGAVLGATANQNLTNGLVGYYKMDETTTGTTQDSSGNGNNGTDTGTTVVSGKFGNARSFNGSSDYSSIGSSSTFNFTTGQSFSIGAWVNVTSSSNFRFIFGQATSGSNGYALAISNSGDAYLAADSGSRGSTSALPTGTWEYVVGVWHYENNSYNLHLYINGTEDTGGSYVHSSTITSAGVSPKIGNRGDTLSANTFYGSIDDLRVYNRALSPAEISQLYNWAPGPVAHYTFDEGSGSTVHDVSGNGNNGTWNGTTPYWTQGKYGDAGNFNGTNDYVAISSNTPVNTIGTDSMTVEAWVRTTSAVYSDFVDNKGAGSNNAGFNLQMSPGGSAYFRIANGTTQSILSPTAMVNDGKWHYIVGVLQRGSTDTMYLYEDGSLIGQGQGSTNIDGWNISSSTPLYIGAWGSTAGNGNLNGQIDDVRIYNYARTQKQIVQDMNGGHPAGGSPVGSEAGYWKFDEGYGSTAHNSGNQGSLLDASLSNTSWTDAGKFNKALSFNGSTSYASVNDTSALDPSSITISTWVKFNSLTGSVCGGSPAGNEYLVFKRNPNTSFFEGYALAKNPSNNFTFTLSSSGGVQDVIASTTTIQTGVWYHVTAVFNQPTMQLYINGVLQATGTHNYPLSYGTYPLYFGRSGECGGAGRANWDTFFNGVMDETKIYDDPLTSSEVAIDYNHGSALSMGALGTTTTSTADNSADRAFCPPGDTSSTCGPIADWEFEEGGGNTLNDSSGNGYTGTWYGSGPYYAQGHVGWAGNFNGTNSYVALNTHAMSNLSSGSVSFWFKANSFNGAALIYEDGGGFNNFSAALPANSSSPFEFNVGNNSNRGTNYTSWSTGKWYFMTVTWTGSQLNLYVNGRLDASGGGASTSTGANNTQIGRYCYSTGCSVSGGYFNGQLDQIHVYNYARTPAQVAWDYNRGAPVAWYKFDECQGTTINDSTGNGYSGTLNGETNPGTCTDGTGTTAWSAGATGKFNSSLNFDGTDDYVSTNYTQNFATAYTISAWVKTTGTGPMPVVQDRGSGAGQSLTLEIGYNGGQNNHAGSVNFGLDTNSTWIGGYTTQTVNDGNWHHIVGVFNDTPGSAVGTSNFSVYIDGKLVTLNAVAIGSANAPLTGLGGTEIGYHQQWNNGYFQGQLDDVRIYDYAMTSEQIQLLYNNGAIFYGPSTGTP